MRGISRDAWLAAGLFLTLALITAAAAVRQTRQQKAPALASFSNAPDGAHALNQWLEELGFTTGNEVAEQFQVPENTRLVFMLEPYPGITEAEWETVDAFVEEGGALILAGESWGMNFAARHYQFGLAFLNQPAPELVPQTALFNSPQIGSLASVQTRAYLETERSDIIIHLAVESRPVLVSFRQGEGQVILFASPFPFSNAGLKAQGNPALALNLVAAVLSSETGKAKIWFDEWHHGVRPDRQEVVGPVEWLRRTPAGRSLLYIVGVIFLALILQGQRFGRAVPLPHETHRRAPLEAITALANLNRRAGHRSAVLRQYYRWLKRELGRRYRLNPTLLDEEYTAELVRFRPGLDGEALLSLLKRLQQQNVSESEMVRLAREATEWIKEI